jgi:chaperonin GroES
MWQKRLTRCQHLPHLGGKRPLARFLFLLRSESKYQNNNKKNTTMNIKPLADRVLILPAPAEEKTVGGIIIPDTAKEKPLKGEVIAVGHGTKDEEMVLKVGDTVLYGKYAGTEIEVDGEKYLMMRQSDVLAILG